MGNNRGNNNDVVGVFYPNKKRNKVRATIEFDDLCREVRRCIIEDLIAGARDDRNDDHHGKKCGCRF
jgi:hypothetical protein